MYSYLLAGNPAGGGFGGQPQGQSPQAFGAPQTPNNNMAASGMFSIGQGNTAPQQRRPALRAQRRAVRRR